MHATPSIPDIIIGRLITNLQLSTIFYHLNLSILENEMSK